MTDKIRNEFAAYGLEMLKRSVLLVLYEVKQQPRGPRLLQMDNIRKRLGIRDLQLEVWVGSTNDLVCGVLQHLKMDGLVDHYIKQGWEITTKGVEFIEG